ncbi:MAG: ABC transporter ATP-binding protein [bacterium]|jgi:ABC-type multidrug transport system ATPase subunit|nr:ABC transporter ATP-binding protein [bacterium]
MKIELAGVGKRYKMEWIIRGVALTIHPAQRYAITGPNGSGKSTLMKMLSGHLTPSKGKIQFSLNDKPLAVSEVYQHLAYAAPYIELIEELTLIEALGFHQRFKSFQGQLQPDDIYRILGFKKARRKLIRNFSSGMKQRLKLALAILSDTPYLLLDEPTTNLDTEGVQWYRQLIEQHTAGRTLVIASNVEVDFDFCEHHINIPQYKP